MHPYPNHYLLCMLEHQNKQAGQPLQQQQKSPPLPRGPQVECSNDSSLVAVEEARKFQPNLAVPIITVIITTSRRQGEEIPTCHSLDPGQADSDALPTQGCNTLSARLHSPIPLKAELVAEGEGLQDPGLGEGEDWKRDSSSPAPPQKNWRGTGGKGGEEPGLAAGRQPTRLLLASRGLV